MGNRKEGAGMKPILFSTEMVKAILEGRKTQTRRIIKPQPTNSMVLVGRLIDTTCRENRKNVGKLHWSDKKEHIFAKDYCQAGDILWVRETWLKADDGYYYKADIKVPSESENLRKTYGYKWRPSIHMPREAARIFLRVTNVRVERLQDITEEDAIKEGVIYGKNQERWTARSAFMDLWDDINKKRGYGWDTNPWVWAISFKRANSETD